MFVNCVNCSFMSVFHVGTYFKANGKRCKQLTSFRQRSCRLNYFSSCVLNLQAFVVQTRQRKIYIAGEMSLSFIHSKRRGPSIIQTSFKYFADPEKHICEFHWCNVMYIFRSWQWRTNMAVPTTKAIRIQADPFSIPTIAMSLIIKDRR